MNYIPKYEFNDERADKDHLNPQEATGTSLTENVSADSSGGFPGCDWTNNVYFYRDVGDGTGESTVDIIPHDELDWKIEAIIDLKENIQRITILKHELFGFLKRDTILHHAFVLLKTDNWYWTVEKNNKCILIQRSNNKSAVKYRIPDGERKIPIDRKRKGYARGRIIDLIDWLYRERELLKVYHLGTADCQVFADRVYDFLLINWSEEIYLYRDVGSGTTLTKVVRVPYQDLVGDFNELFDREAPIDEVYMYKHKLPDSQITDDLQHHYYVLFKSEHWYWTVEKNARYIILQGSKECSGVKAYIQGAQRSNEASEPFDVGNFDDGRSVKVIGDLIKWFDQVTRNKFTDIYKINSQDFARRVYDHLKGT